MKVNNVKNISPTVTRFWQTPNTARHGNYIPKFPASLLTLSSPDSSVSIPVARDASAAPAPLAAALALASAAAAAL